MLTIVCGGLFAGGRELIYNEIQALTEGRRRSYLIVPEQSTVGAEAELTDALPSFAPLYFEATNFSRFCDTVSRKLGGLSGRGADSTERALIIYKVLTELRPLLKTTGGDISSGVVNKTIGAIRKMQSLSLDCDTVATAAEELRGRGGNPRLADKLTDLSLLMSAYSRILSLGYSGAEDVLVKAARYISSSEDNIFRDVKIFIDGFTSFTEPQYGLIAELMRLTDITVHITIPKAAKSAFEYTEPRGAVERLTKIANLAGVDIKIKSIDGVVGVSNTALADIGSNLWRVSPKIDKEALTEGNPDVIRLFEAENIFEECDFLMADIKRRVMAGASYSDFAIVARDISGYSGFIEGAAEKCGIPLFLSGGVSIDTLEAVKLIYSALSSVISGFRREEVISFAKCSLLGIPRELTDELELYMERWGLEGKRLTSPDIWSMNPSGLTTRKREGTDEKLARINETKKRVMEPLMSLSAGISGEHSVKELCEILYGFLTSLGIEEGLRLSAERLKRRGLAELGDRTERAFGLICDTFDTIVAVLNDTRVGAYDFVSILKIAFAEASLGQIPSFRDQVVAGSADTGRFYGKRHIYIIGANMGIFPASAGEEGFFSDSELSALSELGLPTEPEGKKKSAMEYYYFSRAISFARDTVTILYPLLDGSFKPLAPGEAIGRIKEMTEGKITVTRLSRIPVVEKTYCPAYALEHLSTDPGVKRIQLSALNGVGLGSVADLYERSIRKCKVMLKEDSLKLFFPGEISLTHSRLESYTSCPMKYFCSYMLDIDEGKQAEWGSNDIGTFIHAVLENFFRRLYEEGADISKIDACERTRLTAMAAKQYLAGCADSLSLSQKRSEIFINRLTRYAAPIVDSLCDELSASDFKPIFFELRLDDNSDRAPSPIRLKSPMGRDIRIYGTVDRVDAYRGDGEVYLRVIDYKTGSKTFSPADIEKGENLQMFLYLKAITETDKPGFLRAVGAKEGQRLIPAGVLYVKADVSDVTVKGEGDAALTLMKENQKRMGMLLRDDKSLSAMNPSFIPLKYKKDGSPDKRSEARLYDMARWEEIGGIIEGAVGSACDKMTSGDISATPLIKGGKGDACRYCGFKAVCRNSKLF